MQINNHLLGTFISFLGVLFGVVLALLLKKISTELNLISILFYRFVFPVPILIGVAFLARGKFLLNTQQKNSDLSGYFWLPRVDFLDSCYSQLAIGASYCIVPFIRPHLNTVIPISAI